MKLAVLAATLISANAGAHAAIVNFDSDPAGKPPPGWTCGATGAGTPRWSVEAEADAPSRPHVLKQTGKAAFPWCVKDDIALADGSVEVRFKPIAGREDQAGGLVWRWKDGGNYYVARANALENNVSLYHTTDGVRHTIAYQHAPVARNVWHTLRVTFNGTRIEVALDGKTTITADDRHHSGVGKAGVWTKSDSVTAFDDFQYSAASS